MGLAFWVVSGQSSCSCPYLVPLRTLPGSASIFQSRWIAPQGFLGGWQEVLPAGISALLLAPPKFFWLVLEAACCTTVFLITVLLIGTSSCETTPASGYYPCLARVGSFRQQVLNKVKWATLIQVEMIVTCRGKNSCRQYNIEWLAILRNSKKAVMTWVSEQKLQD